MRAIVREGTGYPSNRTPTGVTSFRIGALNIETRKDTCPQDLSIQPREL